MSDTNTVKNLVKKYLDNDIDFKELEFIFHDNNLFDLRRCILMTKNYPELNDFLEEYLKTCEDINKVDDGDRTTLHYAAIYSNIYGEFGFRTIAILIQAGADVFNLKDQFNKAPIDYFSQALLEYCQIDKDTQTIGIKSGKLTKRAKK